MKYLESITLAGSHAKGTALRDSEIDLFLRFSPDTPGPISAIQTSLANHFHGQVRNVSVRITHKGLTVDLVPARNNILWQARFNTWLKTDIAQQIRYVRDSGLIDEILALKPNRPIEEQFTSLLRFLATDFPTTRLLDPANSNNVVSDLLTDLEKLRISRTASEFLGHSSSFEPRL